jgi:hypothetical protein
MAKKLTDLTGDGKVTRADVLKGRGVPGFAKGKGKKRYAEGGSAEDIEQVVTADRYTPQKIDFDLPMGSNPSGDSMGPSMPSGGGMPPPMGPMDPRAAMAARTPLPKNKLQVPIARSGPRGFGYLGPTIRGEGGERISAGVGPRGSFGVGGNFTFKKGGEVKKKPVKKMAKGGSTASSRGDGCATKGKTRGRIV